MVISLRSLLYSVSHSARTENVRRERASMSTATEQGERRTSAGAADRPAGDARAGREARKGKMCGKCLCLTAKVAKPAIGK